MQVGVYMQVVLWGVYIVCVVSADLAIAQKDSAYHLFVLSTNKNKEEEAANVGEWGSLAFDSVYTLSILAGALPSLSVHAADDIWRDNV